MRLLVTAIGAAVFVLSHAIEAAAWSVFAGAFAPWFLNSGRAVLFTAALFFVAGIVVGVFTDRSRCVEFGLFLGLGGVSASVVGLSWWIGAGNLFPIVILVGALVLGLASVAGTTVTALIKRSRTAR